MFIFGITGGIGCGKSTAAGILENKGFKIIDADKISREITSEKKETIDRIVLEFGEGILNNDGKIDRAKLAERVFSNKNDLDTLSMIVHQEVIEEIKRRIEKYKRQKEKVLVLDVPIPVKDGFLDEADKVIVIWANDKVRVQRLIDRGMEEDDIKNRINMQMSKEEYEAFSDCTIDNSTTIEDLEKKILTYVYGELELRGIKV